MIRPSPASLPGAKLCNHYAALSGGCRDENALIEPQFAAISALRTD